MQCTDTDSFCYACRSGADSTLRLWDVAQRACLSTTQTGSQVWAVDWQPIQADQTRVGKDFVWGGEEARVNWMRSAGSGN
jgi:WD repeat-containing protein 61